MANQFIYNLTDSWADAGTLFTAIKMNVTDTASNASSLLMDLQVGGTSKFTVDKVGVATSRTTLGTSSYAVSGGYRILDNAGAGIKYSLFYSDGVSRKVGFFTATDSTAWPGFVFSVSSGMPQMFSLSEAVNNGGGICFPNGLTIGNQSVGTIPTNSVALTGNTATLQLGAVDAASPVAQTLQVQSVVAGTTNTAGANFTINGSKGTGTGAGGSIIFQVAPAGSSGSSQNALSAAMVISPGSSGPTLTFGRAFITNYGQNTATGQQGVCSIGFDGISGLLTIGNPGGIPTTSIPSGGRLAWSSGSNYNWADGDVFLTRDAANTLALRNGANAQTLRIYSTYTDASNYQYASIWATTNAVYIGATGAGTSSPTIDFNIGYDGTSANANRKINFGTRTITFPGGGDVRLTGGTGNFVIASGAGGDIGMLQFGNNTSAFPALKRVASGNVLKVTAADDSNNAGFVVGTNKLATTATDGFLYISSCDGTPTGTPTTQANTVPIVVDTTNNKLYFYSGGAWRDAGP